MPPPCSPSPRLATCRARGTSCIQNMDHISRSKELRRNIFSAILQRRRRADLEALISTILADRVKAPSAGQEGRHGAEGDSPMLAACAAGPKGTARARLHVRCATRRSRRGADARTPMTRMVVRRVVKCDGSPSGLLCAGHHIDAHELREQTDAPDDLSHPDAPQRVARAACAPRASGFPPAVKYAASLRRSRLSQLIAPRMADASACSIMYSRSRWYCRAYTSAMSRPATNDSRL